MTVPQMVDLWRIPAAPPAPRALLSAAEIARADAFRFAADRARFTACRSALRQVLACYLDEAPERIALVDGPHGKPRLPGGGLHFNLAHSGPEAVLAVSRHGPVGIDIEEARSARHADRLLPRVLSPAERAACAALPDAARAMAFLRAWTCKEAYAKATGEGLSLAVTRITVALNGPARLIEVEGRPCEETRWALHALDTGPNMVGALAAAPGAALRWFEHGAAAAHFVPA